MLDFKKKSTSSTKIFKSITPQVLFKTLNPPFNMMQAKSRPKCIHTKSSFQNKFRKFESSKPDRSNPDLRARKLGYQKVPRIQMDLSQPEQW